LPSNYIYGLSEDYVFECDTNNYFLETQSITYREVDYSGEGVQTAVPFEVYTGKKGDEKIPFAQLVGLRDNEMRYYVITETDYAGHVTSYMVQIQGAKFVNNISFIGAITDENEDIQIGCEMHVSKSSIHQFFLNNNSFKFESGEDHYTVLGSTASWHIGDDIGTGPKSETDLINALNNWINVATENGTKCSYTLYDRIGEKEVFEFYNIRETAAKIQLDCYQAGAGSSVIMTSVTNLDELPKILFDDDLASLFKMTIKDITTNDLPTEVYFSLQGTPIQGFDISHDLIITVTDPFGRISITEYHQQKENTIIFMVNGNTVTDNNIIYAGDQRGVRFSYLRTAYNVLFYNAGTGEILSDLQSTTDNNGMVHYIFVPNKNATTIQQYRIVATGRASGAVLFDQTFVFDTRLPDVKWKNASDQSIGDVEGQTFVTEVCFDISESSMPISFPATISYTRTYQGKTERVTLNPGIMKVNFKKPGKYTVTLRNTVWAEKNYNFEIEQVDDNLVSVFDDGIQLQASPSEYFFEMESIKIPRYVFTTSKEGNPFTDYLAHGLEIKIGQTNRELAGNVDLGTDYYYYDYKYNTLVWRLAFCIGENNGVKIYSNPIYFATTGVVNGELNVGNSGSAITLKLNGNPDVKGNSNSLTITPSQTTYHFVYDDFMKTHDEKVEVRLACDASIMRDKNNMPCYMVEGNVIVVDCYYNGKYVKTLVGDGAEQVFTINRYSAGYYEFIVHDLVGNHLYFGSSDNQNDVNYRQERYMLVVMTKPMVLINGRQPVNGMTYNDEVELNLVNYGNKFLSRLYADNLSANKLFFEENFCIREIKVVHIGSTGKEETTITTDGTETDFYWNKSGSYRITVTYRIDEDHDDLKAEYQFQIIPAQTVRKTFSMSIYPGVQIESVKRNGYKIHDYDDLKVNEKMEFNADINPGSYVVTLKTYDNILQEYILHEVKFNIQHKVNSASSYFILSSGSGSETTGAVTLYYNPYWLNNAQGKVTITLWKDFNEQETVVVDSNTLTGDIYNTQELFTMSDAGLYTVRVIDSDGDLVYSDSWTIKAEQSSFGYVILAIVLGLVGVGILIFLRMRRKMSTK